MHRTKRIKIEGNIALAWGTVGTRIERKDIIG